MSSSLSHYSEQQTLPRRTSRYAKILVTKGNPSRGRGYEVAHFVIISGQLKNVADRDVFLPSLTKAAHWVWKVYPSAELATGRRDHTGALAALCFRCAVSDLRRAGD